MLQDNLHLKSILDKFTITTDLQITCIDKSNTLISNSSFSTHSLTKKDLDIIFKNRNKIKNYVDTKMIEFIELYDNKDIAIIYINLEDEIDNYFIIGPFVENKNINGYPYRPKYSIQYICDLFLNIIKDSKRFIPKFSEKIFSLNIKKTIEYIHNNYEKTITVDSMSKMLNVHKCYFCNSFKQETGMTFTNFLCKFRIEKSKELLKNPSLSILDIAISVGFNNQSYYTMMFKKILNITPLEYRKNIA